MAEEAAVPSESTASTVYRVVLNDEEQFSIWWADRPLPAGWHAEGTEGTREECLERINTLWTDMRPLSLRLRMADAAHA
ncbi:MbtH family NRPS accessory protein [Streptomyces sp. SID8379]|uniref:MbtH family protein n=1 Tax=unclassified Streptomyces TaxID=2593676 RepID=UPI00036D6D11|nr:MULTISPECIES: MbtH family NRPS accessory protein [unclassified Streptomyces]MYW67584.1 MbtH family NRPS accessory protein [Streptomyces sp. SID8379]